MMRLLAAHIGESFTQLRHVELTASAQDNTSRTTTLTVDKHRHNEYDHPESKEQRVSGGLRLTIGTAKGTSSFGKRHNKTHVLCRRCGAFGPAARECNDRVLMQ